LFRTKFSKAMRKDPQARILRKQSWGDYFLLALEAPEIAAEAAPGQFLMVRVNDTSLPLLRRPFSIHSAQERSLEIFFQKAGVGTARLSQKEEGDRLDILGPLGRGFSLDLAAGGDTAALVGGGRGIAPLYFMAEALNRKGKKARIYYGGATEADLPLRERFETLGFPLSCSTEDGSFGFEGLITDCLLQDLPSQPFGRIFACGPDGMLERLAGISREFDLPAELSLEAVMGCGFGACWGCVRRLKKGPEAGWHKICEEGPVFPADMIVWGNE
jgi:dihydroorotate dehydrogenase electron transfer subunit